MIFFVVELAVTVLFVVLLVKVVRLDVHYWKARRFGVELQAEVVDNRAGASGQRGTYRLTPVVRYHLEGRSYEADILNPSGAPGEKGTSMTILVNAERPYEPYDRYRDVGSAVLGVLAVLALNVALLILAISRLRPP
jgi:hypothetical protein